MRYVHEMTRDAVQRPNKKRVAIAAKLAKELSKSYFRMTPNEGEMGTMAKKAAPKAKAKAAKPVKPAKAQKTTQPAKVEKSEKVEKAPKAAEKPAKAEKPVKAEKAKAPEGASEEYKKWIELKNRHGQEKATAYSMSGVYEAGRAIDHKVLGWGWIMKSENDRLEVLFEQGLKYLISNYKPR